MAEVKLQYSLICRLDENFNIYSIIHGFNPGYVNEFYISNKWIWDENQSINDGFFQITDIICNGTVMASSISKLFDVRESHTHHNRFQGIYFSLRENYRIRTKLFNKKGQPVKSGSIDYPVIIKSTQIH